MRSIPPSRTSEIAGFRTERPRRARRALAAALATLLGIGASLIGVAPAHAATIYSEDFTGGFGAGWAQPIGPWTVISGEAVAGASPSGSTLARMVDTTGFENIQVSFDYSVSNHAAPDFFLFNYSTNGGGNQENTPSVEANTAGFVSASYTLVPAAADNDDLLIRFNAAVLAGSDIRIDNVVITGDPLDVTPPSVTADSPSSGGVIPDASATAFAATVSDNATAAGDIDVEYTFSAGAASYDVTATNSGGSASASVTGSQIATALSLSPGDRFDWSIEATDDEGNPATTTVEGLYYDENIAPVITTTALGDGELNSSYSDQVVATGSDPIEFTATGLPAGLSIGLTTGVISGTPTAAGTFSVTVTATNGVSSAFDTETLSLVIAEAPTITTMTLPNGLVGAAYTGQTITADGDAPFTYSATGLPPGIALDPSSGALSGVPTTGGEFDPEFTVTNDTGADTQTISLDIDEEPTITSGAPIDGELDASYDFTVTASGSPAPEFSVSAGALPTGLSLDEVTGAIDGTPTATGDYTFTISASNGIGSADTATYTITVIEAPEVTTSSLPDGEVGVAYSESLTVTGDGPFTYSATGLPPGLTIDASSGEISGEPTTAGEYDPEFTVANAINTDIITLELDVDEAPTITTGAPVDGTVGEIYSFVIEATGTPDPTFAVTAGALPDGLTLDGGTGAITGIPTTQGSSVVTITASNGIGADDDQEYTIVIAPAPETPVITSGAPGDGVVGNPYSFDFSASGVPAPEYSVDDDLPPGLVLDQVTGVMSGTPLVAGEFEIVINAINTEGVDSETYTITMTEAPTVTSSAPPVATAGTPFSYLVEVDGTPPFTFDIVLGGLPSGLTLDETTGEIVGTPAETGTFTVMVEISNPSGEDTQVELTFVVTAAASDDGSSTLADTGANAQGALLLAMLLLGGGALVLGRRALTHL